MMKWINFTFQNMLNTTAVSIDWLHDYVIMFLIFIIIFVGSVMLSLFKNMFFSFFSFEFSVLEVVWTIIPAMILLCLGVPSLMILYQTEKNFLSHITLKVTGHQWFWSYDYSNFSLVEFDSYLTPLGELNKGHFRLLMTDAHPVFPMNTNGRFIISSADVLHSWTIPCLSFKADANPGRLNIVNSSFPVCGLYFGQCSEICGANHSFMPICLEVTTFSMFKNWLKCF